MMIVRSIAFSLIILTAGTGLIAGEIVTYTDDRGDLFITNGPPPKDARIRDVVRYREKRDEEIEAFREGRETEREERLRQNRARQAEKSRQQAEEARQAAEAAVVRAEEAGRQASEYIGKYGSRKKKRKWHQSQIRRLTEEARVAEEQATEAVARANQARKEALKASEGLREAGVEPAGEPDDVQKGRAP